MAKVLTVYFSHAGENYFPGGLRVIEKGNTQYAAEYIQGAVGGDLFRIQRDTPYPQDYRGCVEQSKAEMLQKARPQLLETMESLDGFDTVFVCYPCWCGTAPMCVFTFLESFDLTGKKIIPLCTNEGSGMGGSIAHLKESCPGAEITEGLSLRGHQAQDSREFVANWAKSQL